MKCDRCDREATVHELRVAGGKKLERHLCESCARDTGIAVPGAVNVPELVEKMLSPKAQEASASAKPRPAPAVPGQACPACGLTYVEFRQSGQLGCERCYEAFESQLGPLLERWHEGGSRHVGKLPARALGTGATSAGKLPEAILGGAAERAAKVESLEKQLAEALRAEQYERAAALRDEIRKLSGLEAGRARRSDGASPV
jgi:protein arginine kinase activator